MSQNLSIQVITREREFIDPILTGQLTLSLSKSLAHNNTSASSSMQENFILAKVTHTMKSSSVFVTNKGENNSVIDTIEQISDKPALPKNNLTSTNGSSNETRVKSGQVFVVD